MRNKKLIIITIISILAIVFLILKGSVFLSLFKSNSIIILDDKGNEIYRTNEKLESDLENEVIISDNGVADSIIYQVVEDIQASLNCTKEEAIKLLNKDEYVIYSTIDTSVQEKLNQAFNDRSTFTTTKKANFNEAAMVIMDYEGNIKAVATTNNNDNSINRATSKLLKVGSTIKPVAIYTPAIENNIVNFSTIIDDVPGNTTYNGEAIEWPTNYDNKYESNVTITDALKKSKNTVAVSVGKMVGEEEIFNFLKDKLHYDTLVDSTRGDTDKQLSALALGYFTNGVTLDTLVSSYSMFGNGGYYSGKRYYTEVKDKDGNVLVSSNNDKSRVITEETATIMNRLLLNNIVDEDSIIKNIGIDGVEVLGKTGTVGNDNGENISQLFVGMTPDYIAGVWVGYDDNRALMPGLYNGPTTVWQAVMSNINLENSHFKLSNNVKELEYCGDSGLLKSDNCKNIKVGYYKEGNIPSTCNSCK